MLLLVIGSSVLLVASPPVWGLVYEAPESAPIYAQQDAELIALNLWTEKSYEKVSDELKGGQLITKEVDHYEDLQVKFEQLVWLVILSAIFVVIVFCQQKKSASKVIGLSLAWLLVIGLLGWGWSLYNWRQMFRTLHWWIFQDDSWILPWSSYSLKLFPYYVWKTSMVFVLAMSVCFYVFFLSLSFRKRGAEAKVILKE